MSLSVGQAAADPVTGLAGNLYNLRVYGNLGGTGSPRAYFALDGGGAISAAARAIVADECAAMATWIRDVLLNQMVAVARVNTGFGGLQQYDPGGGAIDTQAPTADRDIPVVIS